MKNVASCTLPYMLFQDVYGFVTEKHVFLDKLYLLNFVTVPLSWILCQDECLISYLVKKCANPAYILGQEPERVDDLRNLFARDDHYWMFYHVNHALRVGSVLWVNARTTHVGYGLLVPTCICYLAYSYDVACRWDYRKFFYPWFHALYVIYILAVFVTVCLPGP